MKKSSLCKSPLNREFCYELFVIFLWCRSILVSYARAMWMTLPAIWGMADLMVNLVFGALLFFSLNTFMRRLWVGDILFVIFSLLIYAAYYWIFPLNQRYYGMYAETFAEKALPMFLVGASILPRKSERLFRWMYWASIATIFAFSAYKIILNPLSAVVQADGDMYSAYLFLPHLCTVTGYTIKKASLLNIAATVPGALVLISLGTRGVVVCFLAFVVLMLLLFQKNKHPVLIVSMVVLMMIFLLAGGLLDWLHDFAEEFGLSLRVLDKLESGDFGQSSGRTIIAERVLEYILLYPLTGLGIYSDRRVAGGQYAHNVILELVIDFGVIVGLLLFVAVAVLIVKAVISVRRQENDNGTVVVLLTYICCGFVKLFLSGSYLNEETFFFLLGFCVAVLREDISEKLRSRNIRTPESVSIP